MEAGPLSRRCPGFLAMIRTQVWAPAFLFLPFSSRPPQNAGSLISYQAGRRESISHVTISVSLSESVDLASNVKLPCSDGDYDVSRRRHCLLYACQLSAVQPDTRQSTSQSASAKDHMRMRANCAQEPFRCLSMSLLFTTYYGEHAIKREIQELCQAPYNTFPTQ